MKLLTSIILLLGASTIYAQIPNADFESWSFNGWNYTPDEWVTGNTELQEPVSQDLDAYQGDYAMRVTAVPYPLGKFGEATVSFPNEVVPPSLDFWVKSSLQNAYVEVRIEFWNEDLLVYFEQWLNTDQIDEWTFVSIPLNQIEPILTDANIYVTALVGDFVDGDAEISIDAMGFGQPQSVSDYSEYEFTIYPNPAQNTLKFTDEEGAVEYLELYSLDGKQIQTIQVNSLKRKEIDISRLANGVYQLVLKHGARTLGTEKLVVSR